MQIIVAYFIGTEGKDLFMELIVILISLCLLMVFAFRGYSLILFAPLCAMLAAAMSDYSLMPLYSELFMTKAAEYVKVYYSIFLLGAVFAKVMEEAGMARSIAAVIAKCLGKERAILSVILACGVLTYGGISVFVVAFVMYPFAAILFREANIPKRLIPATIWTGMCTYGMVALPGTPQIQNIIPTSFFGTTTWAAPITGIFASVIYFALTWFWITYRYKKLSARGEGYGNHTLNEPEMMDNSGLPSWKKSLIPLATVVIVNLLMSNPFHWSWAYHWGEQLLESFKPLNLSLLASSVDKVQAIWSLDVGLTVGIVLAVIIGRKQLLQSGGIIAPLNAGTLGSVSAIMNTASGYAFGTVISSLAGFQIIKDQLLQIHLGSGPLVSEVITTNIMSGFTGSASGGMTIALNMLGANWLAWANSLGMSPEILHRIVSLSSAGFESVPHNGALVTLIAICGLTHKQSYYDIFMLSVFKLAVPFLCIALYSTTGLL